MKKRSQPCRRDVVEQRARDSARRARPRAPLRRCRWRRSAPSAAPAASPCARAAGSRANRPPRRWRSPAPRRAPRRRRPFPSNKFGMTMLFSASKASASRKKLVTPISRSRNSAVTSRESERSRSTSARPRTYGAIGTSADRPVGTEAGDRPALPSIFHSINVTPIGPVTLALEGVVVALVQIAQIVRLQRLEVIRVALHQLQIFRPTGRLPAAQNREGAAATPS